MGADAPGIDPALLAREASSFVIDSREIKAGDVFFALSQPEYRDNGFNGDFEDATRYVVPSLEAGAVAAVVRHDRYNEHEAELSPFSDRLIFTDDVIIALQSLAHRVYLDWGGSVVAVTGSAGKTTAKELIAHVLSGSGKKVLKNIKNYNNGLGHPLTVLNLAGDKSFDIAVLEMGMSTPMHEIARLCRITPPDVSVVLNVLPVHVEHLGSIDNVASAKAEIVEGAKRDGSAVLNADDERVLAMREKAPGRVVTFGIETTADVRAVDIERRGFGDTTFTLATSEGEVPVRFQLNGKHNILNALAAAAVGLEFGMTPEAIASQLETMTAPSQRGEIVRFKKGFTVINDSYNSNPDALLSMVDTLVEASPEGSRKIVVAGEMLELGPEAAALHRRTGQAIAGKKADVLIGVRGLAAELVAGAKEAGLGDAEFAEDSAAAGKLLADRVAAGDTVLIKGSRGVRTEKVLETLCERFDQEELAAVKR